MTQDQERKLDLIRDDGNAEVANLIDTLFARIEGLEFQVRQLRSEHSPLAGRTDMASRRRLMLPATW